MAYDPLDLTELDVGKPVRMKLFTTIRLNEEDHEARIDNLEEGATKVVVCDMELIGYISHYSPSELVGIATHRAPSNFNLLEFVVTIMDSENGFNSVGVPITSSSAGSLQVDLKRSVDGGVSWSSILTQQPRIPDGKYGRGVSSASTGCYPSIFTTTSMNQDDFLRVDVMAFKDTQGTFHVSIYGSLD